VKKVIITAAICGAEVTKANNPAVPYSLEELVNEANSAYEAGAAIIHLHVRWDNGEPTQDRGRYQRAMEKISKVCPGIIILPSTGGAVGMSVEERIQPVELKPEMATVDCGTMNFGGNDIFVNTEDMMISFVQRMQEVGVMPELECFDKGMLDTVLRLSKEGIMPEHLHFNFVLGVKGGMAAVPENLFFLVSSLPHDATWGVSGVGSNQFDMVVLAILLGGNVRVGFEDNVYVERGKLAANNGELVEKTVKIATMLGREVATAGEARKMLGLKEV
jgi:3-keto-5-aminohexanoate cleavage enzyme